MAVQEARNPARWGRMLLPQRVEVPTLSDAPDRIQELEERISELEEEIRELKDR